MLVRVLQRRRHQAHSIRGTQRHQHYNATTVSINNNHEWLACMPEQVCSRGIRFVLPGSLSRRPRTQRSGLGSSSRYTPVLQYFSRRANILETCEPWEESWRPVSHGSCPGGLERCLGSCSLAPLLAFVENCERSKMTPPTLLRSPFYASSSRPSSPVGEERLILLRQFFLIVFHDLIAQHIKSAIPQFCSIFPAVRTSFQF